MHGRMPRAVAALGVLCVAILCPRSQAPAAAPGPAGIGLDVNPAKVDFVAPPSSTYNIPVMVRNDNDVPVHVVASPSDYKLDESGRYHYSHPGSNAVSLAKWVSVNPREFDLMPQAFQQVRLTVSVPDAPAPGEYGGIVFFQTRPGRTDQRGVVFSARIGTKLYGMVGDDRKVAGEIAAMSASADGSSEHYAILFKNTGNVHVYVNGRIEVRHDGAVVAKLPLPDSTLVDRGSDRLIVVDGTALRSGEYDVVAIVDYGGPQRIGGKIKVDAK